MCKDRLNGYTVNGVETEVPQLKLPTRLTSDIRILRKEVTESLQRFNMNTILNKFRYKYLNSIKHHSWY